jgi:hypothetical protein
VATEVAAEEAAEEAAAQAATEEARLRREANLKQVPAPHKDDHGIPQGGVLNFRSRVCMQINTFVLQYF